MVTIVKFNKLKNKIEDRINVLNEKSLTTKRINDRWDKIKRGKFKNHTNKMKNRIYVNMKSFYEQLKERIKYNKDKSTSKKVQFKRKPTHKPPSVWNEFVKKNWTKIKMCPIWMHNTNSYIANSKVLSYYYTLSNIQKIKKLKTKKENDIKRFISLENKKVKWLLENKDLYNKFVVKNKSAEGNVITNKRDSRGEYNLPEGAKGLKRGEMAKGNNTKDNKIIKKTPQINGNKVDAGHKELNVINDEIKKDVKAEDCIGYLKGKGFEISDGGKYRVGDTLKKVVNEGKFKKKSRRVQSTLVQQSGNNIEQNAGDTPGQRRYKKTIGDLEKKAKDMDRTNKKISFYI